MSGLTRIVVDKSVYNEFDCGFEVDDDYYPSLRRMFVNNEGGIYIYRCSFVRYLSSHQSALRTSRSLSVSSTMKGSVSFFGNILGITFLFLVFSLRRRIMKIFRLQ